MAAKKSAAEKSRGKRQEPKTRSRSATVTAATGSKVPRLMLIGRGTLEGRKLHAIRIRPAVIERLAEVASGPMYLVVEIAINRLIAELEARSDGQIEVIRVEHILPG